MLAWCLTFFCGAFVLHTVTSDLTETPVNIAGIKSTDVTFPCTTNSSYDIRWTVNGSTVAIGDEVIDGVTDKYEITVSEGSHPLTVKNVDDTVVGIHECYDIVTQHAFAAQLIAIDDQITSSSTIGSDGIIVEGRMFHYECSVSYTGKWAPVVKLYDDGDEVANTNDTNIGGVVKSSITSEARRSMTGTQYSCEAFFEGPLDPAPGDLEADNVPEYNREVVFNHTIEVHYGPEDVELSPDQDRIYVGTDMMCNFVSNPSASNIQFIHTTEEGDEQVVQEGTGNNFVLPSEWNDSKNHTLRCLVEVIIGSGSGAETRTGESQEVTFEAYTTTTTSTTTTSTTTTTTSATTDGPGGIGGDNGSDGGLGAGAIAGIIIVVIIVIIIAIIVAYCLIKKSRDSKGKESSPTPKQPEYLDRVRTPSISDSKPPLNTAGPPPYNGAMPYDNTGYYGTASTLPYSPASTLDRHPNAPYPQPEEQLAVDDRPRSRKPIQLMDTSMDFQDSSFQP